MIRSINTGLINDQCVEERERDRERQKVAKRGGCKYTLIAGEEEAEEKPAIQTELTCVSYKH